MGGLGSGPPLGNNNATKNKRWKDALWKALARLATDKQGAGETLEKIAAKVVQGALEGDKDCWTEIGNRLDGKPAQAIVGDNDHDAINVREIVIRAVGPVNDRPPDKSF